MAQKRICRDFMANPKRDPIDGHRLIPGKGPYRGYTMMCAENGFEVDYMLDENFMNELSSKPKRSTSPSRSTSRSPQRSTSPNKRNLLPLRSQPVLQKSIPSATKPNNLQPRSPSNQRLTTLNTQTTQTLYPKVVAPSRIPLSSTA